VTAGASAAELSVAVPVDTGAAGGNEAGAVLQSGKLKSVATASMFVQGNATLGGAMSLQVGKLTSGSSGLPNAAADWSVFVQGTTLDGAVEAAALVDPETGADPLWPWRRDVKDTLTGMGADTTMPARDTETEKSATSLKSIVWRRNVRCTCNKKTWAGLQALPQRPQVD